MGKNWSSVVITVIIPTRNRAGLLALALNSLTLQTLSVEAFEVLVIDNASTDQTAAIAHDFFSRLKNYRYIYEPEPGLHAGRHRGMQEAIGDILAFADDDIEACPTWLSSIADAFSTPGVAMVGGNNLPLFLAPPPAWVQRLWARSITNNVQAFPPFSILKLAGPSREFSPYMVWGCNFAIRKTILLAAGGFHPDSMPSEMIRFRGDGETHVSRFVAESGNKCVFHPGATVYHKVTPERMSFQYFRQRGFNQGISDSYTALRNQNVQPVQSGHFFLVRLARKVWHRLKDLALIDPAARRAIRELTAGHREGYAYHQRMYVSDVEVREWVHKPKYFLEQTR